jgi:hypothetical protein
VQKAAILFADDSDVADKAASPPLLPLPKARVPPRTRLASDDWPSDEDEEADKRPKAPLRIGGAVSVSSQSAAAAFVPPPLQIDKDGSIVPPAPAPSAELAPASERTAFPALASTTAVGGSVKSLTLGGMLDPTKMSVGMGGGMAAIAAARARARAAEESDAGGQKGGDGGSAPAPLPPPPRVFDADGDDAAGPPPLPPVFGGDDDEVGPFSRPPPLGLPPPTAFSDDAEAETFLPPPLPPPMLAATAGANQSAIAGLFGGGEDGGVFSGGPLFQ